MGRGNGRDAAFPRHGRKQILMKHARDLAAHTVDGCDLLRIAEVGMVAHLINAARDSSITDEERETFHAWMDARRCLHLTTVEMPDDDLPLDGQVFASICPVCARASVLCLDERKKFLTVECDIQGDVPRGDPRQLDQHTCKHARQLVMNAAISEVCGFDKAWPSADFVIDAEIFYKKWNAALAMMGWKPVVSHPPPDLECQPRLRAVLLSGILCEACDDVLAVELEDDGIHIVVCPFNRGRNEP